VKRHIPERRARAHANPRDTHIFLHREILPMSTVSPDYNGSCAPPPPAPLSAAIRADSPQWRGEQEAPGEPILNSRRPPVSRRWCLWRLTRLLGELSGMW
jgi:hypothetical protein